MCSNQVRRARRRAGLAACLAVGGGVLGGMPAQAATSCLYDPLAHSVSIESDELDLRVGALGIAPPPFPIFVEAAEFPRAPCGAATVDNTDSIHVTVTAEIATVYLDLSSAPLRPGLTREHDGASEIEVSVAGAYWLAIEADRDQPRRFSIGDQAAAWTSDGDADIAYPAADNPQLNTLVGPQIGASSIVSGRGGHGTGGPLIEHGLIAGV